MTTTERREKLWGKCMAELPPDARGRIQSEPAGHDALCLAVTVELLAMGEELISRLCRRCGCTQNKACIDARLDQPCSWAEPDLCSACLTPPEFKRFTAGHKHPSLGRK